MKRKDKVIMVSVITVVLNGEKTIERTIQSVINQTYKNIEYIIIDGGSSDSTLKIVSKYQNYISQIVSEKDNGIYDAMNKGIELAHGDLIGIINSDDWYELDTVETVEREFKKYGNVLYYGIQVNHTLNGDSFSTGNSSLRNIFFQMVTPHSTIFIPKKIYQKYGVFNLNYKSAADYELVLRLYVKRVYFRFINKELSHFSYGGYTTVDPEINMREALDIMLHYYEYSTDKEVVAYQIKTMVKSYKLEKRLSNSEFLQKFLEQNKFHITDKVIVFGTGVWGEKITRALELSKKEILFFVDNDIKKITKKFMNKKVYEPRVLRTYNNTIFVAIKYHEDEILCQLKKMRIEESRIILLSDLMDIC